MGKRFEITNTTTKFYPYCQGNHGAIYGALQLAREHGIKAKEIDEVRIHTNTFFANILGTTEKVRPRNVNEAQFSYYYTAACALVTGTVGLKDFTESAISRRDVLQVAERVKVVPVLEKDVLEGLIPPIDVEIVMRDSTSHQQSVPFVKGSPQYPAKREDLLRKFDECGAYAAQHISQSQVDEVKGLIDELETLDDVTVITDRLSLRTA